MKVHSMKQRLQLMQPMVLPNYLDSYGIDAIVESHPLKQSLHEKKESKIGIRYKKTTTRNVLNSNVIISTYQKSSKIVKCFFTQ